MLPRLLLAAFLLGHAAIQVSFLTPRPPATAGGPVWPFELGRSWILTPLLFFHPWLVLGIAIDLGLLWAVLVADRMPQGTVQ